MEELLQELLQSLPPDEVEKILNSPLDWGETFLVNPTQKNAFQANFVQRQILGSKKRFNVIRVHRRAGKTYSFAVLALFYSLMLDSCQILIAAPGAIQIQELFTTIREFIRVNPWVARLVTSDTKSPQRIEFTNGSRITGLTTGSRTKGGGKAFRGQGADVFLIDEAAYLGEADWTALNAIMKGDQYRRFKVRVFAASTPALTRGRYYDLCLADKYRSWNRIHVRVTDNPDISEEDREEARTLSNDLEWTTEWQAEFPEIGQGVFPKSLIDLAKQEYSYQSYYADSAKMPFENPNRPLRTIGVDWDKFNADGFGPNITVLEAQADGTFRIIYREEIPQSKYSLTFACERVIKLNEVFQPKWIFIDRGYGDMQLEHLELYAQKFPQSGLAEKLVGIQFGQLVEVPQPFGGVEKKVFKQAMVNLLRKWMEDGRLQMPKEGDDVLLRQFGEYHVVGQSEKNIKYADEFDHAIASVGLACWAMHEREKNPYQPKRATKSYMVKAPEPVTMPQGGQSMDAHLRSKYGAILTLDDRGQPVRPMAGFHRGSLGDRSPLKRSSF